MADTLFPLPDRPLPQRRGARLSPNGKPLGRPPGAKGRRSIDLARYIEATFGGMTPGQQSAQLALVTPRELKAARGSMLQAQAIKALELADVLRCDPKEAFLLLQRERTELLAYVHQKQPAAEPTSARQLPVMFVASEADMAQAALGAPVAEEDVEILEGFETPTDQVGRSKSDDDA